MRCFKTRAQRALRAHTVSFYTHVWSAVHIAKARSSKYWEKPGRLLRNGEGVHLRRRGATDTDCAASAPRLIYFVKWKNINFDACGQNEKQMKDK